jgi:hypothetical protein
MVKDLEQDAANAIFKSSAPRRKAGLGELHINAITRLLPQPETTHLREGQPDSFGSLQLDPHGREVPDNDYDEPRG